MNRSSLLRPVGRAPFRPAFADPTHKLDVGYLGGVAVDEGEPAGVVDSVLSESHARSLALLARGKWRTNESCIHAPRYTIAGIFNAKKAPSPTAWAARCATSSVNPATDTTATATSADGRRDHLTFVATAVCRRSGRAGGCECSIGTAQLVQRAREPESALLGLVPKKGHAYRVFGIGERPGYCDLYEVFCWWVRDGRLRGQYPPFARR